MAHYKVNGKDRTDERDMFKIPKRYQKTFEGCEIDDDEDHRKARLYADYADSAWENKRTLSALEYEEKMLEKLNLSREEWMIKIGLKDDNIDAE